MQLRSLILAFAIALLGTIPADAQRGGRPSPPPQAAPAPTWELLGETRVGFGADSDVISIGRPEGHFLGRSYSRLRINAERGEFRMRAVRVRYINGFEETINIERLLSDGEGVIVELPERRSFLSQITLFYAARPGISFDGRRIAWNNPRARVFGEVRAALPPPRPVLGREWSEIGRATLSPRQSEAVAEVGRQKGRFAQFRIWNEGPTAVNIDDIVVQFGNRQTERIRVRARLGRGDATEAVSVRGESRFIESITINYSTSDGRAPAGPGRGGPPLAELVVFGADRSTAVAVPPAVDPRRNWVLLGQERVSFQNERDSIRIGHGEEWYRTRGFDRLHFLSAEGAIQLNEIRITYINGFSELVRVDRTIEQGSSLTVELPGRRSYLREIEMNYRARLRGGGRGLIQVFGEQADGPPRR